jgi:hypothetical protein
LKTFPIGCRRARLSLVGIDNHDLIGRPTECDRSFAQGILPLRAFRVLKNLTDG